MNIQYKNLEIQEYFIDTKFNRKEKELLFKLRTRMSDVKLNFRSMHQDLKCNLCDENARQSPCSKVF